jgi:Protein of unknown function (DUF1236)
LTATASRNKRDPDVCNLDVCNRNGSFMMRNSAFIAALLASIVALPLAASAQDTILAPGVTTGSAGLQGDLDNGIAADQRRNFRSYVADEQTPSYLVPGEIRIGTTLPDIGVTYYDVPERFGATRYRYTIVNDRTVLVDPRTRKVVQLVD